MTKTEDLEIKDIDLLVTAKQRFRINGDNTKIVELNTSDLGIITRIEEAQVKFDALTEKLQTTSATLIEGDNSSISTVLKDIDSEMRELVDFIFDSPVSSVCVVSGTMYDPINGKLRYEHIIETLMKLYEDTITTEYKKIKNRTAKHTSKYTKKRSR